MQRREVLRAIAGASAAGTVGRTGIVGATGSESTAATAQNGYEPLGAVDLPGARDLATSEDGTVAYVAVDDGIATVDCSNPSSPTVLAERRDLLADVENGPLRLLWDVWPDGDRLLAVAQANSIDERDLHAALLFDVSEPADPQLLDHYETVHPIHNSFFADGVAYLTGNGLPGNPLVVLDASDDELVEVGQWSILEQDERWADANAALYQLHDCYVQDDVAYLAYWDAGTWLLDVSDPSSPTYLGHTAQQDPSELVELGDIEAAYAAQTPPGNAHYVQVDETGDLLVVGREAWAAVAPDRCLVGGAGGVDLYDASDPQSIEHLAHVEPPASYIQTRGGPFTTAHNVDVVDDRLYCSWYFGGVSVHDVSEPSSPEELARWRDPDEAAFWTAQSAVPGEYFLASSAEDAGGFESQIDGRVYVFPDEPGEQADPPSLTDPPDDFEAVPRCEDDDVTDLVDGDENTTVGGSDAVENGAGEESGDDSDAEPADDAMPGFGVAAGLAGTGLAAGWLRARADRRSSNDTDE